MASRPNTRLAGTLFAILSLFILPAVSQQGVLVNGNSQLPSCAQQCALLNQAAQACSGTTSASTQVWSCFCQSAYLTPLKAGGAGTGVCDQQCTNPTDNQQVATWYRSNCGNDFGASEHADAGTGTTNGNNNAGNNGGTNTQNPAATTSATTVATATPQTSSGGGGSWWSNHYQWIIMVIVLFFGLIGLAVFLTWLRRRHERKQDQIRNGFNHGVTSQSAPTGINAANSRAVEPMPTHDSAQRTRESFMPYGYGYSRSDSRVGSRSSRIDDRRSPIPRGGTPVTDREKEAAVGGNTQASSDDEITKAPPRGILVRERSGQESTNGEKN